MKRTHEMLAKALLPLVDREITFEMIIDQMENDGFVIDLVPHFDTAHALNLNLIEMFCVTVDLEWYFKTESKDGNMMTTHELLIETYPNLTWNDLLVF